MTENGLASIKRCVLAKFPTANGLIIIVKIMLMTMMKIIMIITIEKGEAYHLVPKSILLVNIRVIWKVNTALDLVQSFELNNAGQLTNTFVSWSLAVKLGMHFSRKFP